jgi:hypothetical protein
MTDKTLVQKLAVKEDSHIYIVNAPPGYKGKLGALPRNARLVTAPTKAVDVIQVFVASRKELEAHLPKLKLLLAPYGTLWVTYPKGTSKTKTDINRDSIRAYARSLGLETVAIFAVDEEWSALRLKTMSHQ